MRYDDEDYTLWQRRDYWEKWVEALGFVSICSGVFTFAYFVYRIDGTPMSDKAWYSVIIFLASVLVWWQQRKKVIEIDEKMEAESAKSRFYNPHETPPPAKEPSRAIGFYYPADVFLEGIRTQYQRVAERVAKKKRESGQD